MNVWHETDIDCELQYPDDSGPCGGSIQIKDWGDDDDESDTNFRFEASCGRCLTCDPNGYRTLAEAMDGAGDYFKDSS